MRKLHPPKKRKRRIPKQTAPKSPEQKSDEQQ
jgi:hypothetical protein